MYDFYRENTFAHMRIQDALAHAQAQLANDKEGAQATSPTRSLSRPSRSSIKAARGRCGGGGGHERGSGGVRVGRRGRSEGTHNMTPSIARTARANSFRFNTPGSPKAVACRCPSFSPTHVQ